MITDEWPVFQWVKSGFLAAIIYNLLYWESFDFFNPLKLSHLNRYGRRWRDRWKNDRMIQQRYVSQPVFMPTYVFAFYYNNAEAKGEVDSTREMVGSTREEVGSTREEETSIREEEEEEGTWSLDSSVDSLAGEYETSWIELFPQVDLTSISSYDTQKCMMLVCCIYNYCLFWEANFIQQWNKVKEEKLYVHYSNCKLSQRQ